MSSEMRDDGGAGFSELVSVMRKLRGQGGCPWDRAQDFASLRGYLLEECYELLEALDARSPAGLREELGDLSMQIAFIAELAREAGWFTIDDAIAGICEKLVRRHPHVWAPEGMQAIAGDPGSQASWEAHKRREKGERGALAGVPLALPALLRAVRIGEKAARVGYDWADTRGPRAKIDEELAELDAALIAEDRVRAEQELGDVLFALASLARKNDLDPESALRGTLARFSARFAHCEAAARTQGRELSDFDEAALDALWQRAKQALG